jgi:hypothetical protein
MFTYFLAAIVWSTAATVPPKMVAAYAENGQAECRAEAERLNKLPEMQAAEAIAAGAEFICLKVERVHPV